MVNKHGRTHLVDIEINIGRELNFTLSTGLGGGIGRFVGIRVVLHFVFEAKQIPIELFWFNLQKFSQL